MPHISLDNDLPGILSLFAYRPETSRPLSELAEILLRGPSTLSRGERELIAAHVSALNDCHFCTASHGAIAAAQLPDGTNVVGQVGQVGQVGADLADAPVSDRLPPLLALAAAVQSGGRQVRPEHIEEARAAGATDVEIHDTVLIAAAFCMYNRYVDGLATVAPKDPAAYAAMADRVVGDGYLGMAPPGPGGPVTGRSS